MGNDDKATEKSGGKPAETSEKPRTDESYLSFMQQVDQLNSKRSFYRQALNALESYIKMKEKPAYVLSLMIDQFEVCKKAKLRIETFVEEIYKVKYEKELKSHFAEKMQFDAQFYKFKIVLLDLDLAIDDVPSSTRNVTNSTLNNSSITGQIKLPPLTLPVFTGKFDEWISFSESFRNAVENNDSLCNVEKLQYLRGSLKFDAFDVIKNLEISDANFVNALELLRERYENKKIIVHNHIKALFDLNPVIKENYVQIRHILDTVLQHVRSLSAIKRPVQHWDDLLIYLVVNKLPYNTRKDWETTVDEKEIPTFKNLTDFLTRKCRTLAAIQSKDEPPNRYNVRVNKFPEKQVNCHLNTVSKFCHFCKNNEHFLSQCQNYLNLTIDQRFNFVKENFLCVNCLRKHHTSKFCKSARCRICNKAHNSTLHREIQNTSVNTSNVEIEHETEPQASTSSASFLAKSVQNVLLSTCIIFVKDSEGKFHETRALLDSGSQINIITDKLHKKLKLPLKQVNISIVGISEKVAVSNKMTELFFKSRYTNYSRNIEAVILDRICNNIPAVHLDSKLITIPSNVTLADEQYYKSREIDMLIGAEFFAELYCIGQIRTNVSSIILQKSVFGWLLSGSIKQNACMKATCALTNLELDENLTRFWQLDPVTDKVHLTQEELSCQAHFKANIKRDASGRFIASLPLKSPPEDLGKSLNIAKSRFINLENKLYKNNDLKTEYDKFMNEYLDLGHMQCIGKLNEFENVEDNACYLPHHPVFKATSLTTKIRVVFNASSKTSNNISLNDILMKGPVLQDFLRNILLRFRFYKYVVTADICKMYRQILINSSQTKLQRILYRFSREDPIYVFELLTLTYGTKSASYIAQECLDEIARFIETIDPDLAYIIIKNFYMDDLLTGCNSVQELKKFVSDINQLFSKFGFSLMKWCANSSEVLDELDNHSDKFLKIELGDNEKLKILGISWVPHNDTIIYTHQFDDNIAHVTKRTVLSKISQIFDPLGLLGPYITLAKLLMQDIWKIKLTWDESLPQEFCTRWYQFCDDLNFLNAISIPRNLKYDISSKIELHAFADASEAAYGIAIFAREIKENGDISCNLICSKSRVAPLKNVSLPRLELCAALLLAEGVKGVVDSLQKTVRFSAVKYYSDSTIVLCWINNTPGKWKTFVANRVSAIQENSNVADWHHVKSECNPADVISRGSSLSDLSKNRLWWFGPQVLRDADYLPESFNINNNNTNIIPEMKVLIATTDSDSNIDDPFFDTLIEKFSSLNKLVRVLAYILRFLKNCKRSPISKINGYLTVDELNDSENILIKHIQKSHFLQEIKLLKNKQQINSTSKILALTPFLDENDILRVGGRLRHSNLSSDAKHTILLPKKCHFTNLVINKYHLRSLHSGPQGTLALVRTKYWIVAGKDAIRQIVRKCTVCLRSDPKFSNPIMGDLPVSRVTACRPFSRTGIDFFGPFYIKEGSRKTRKIIKCYGCVFVCLATKAVHCEIVEDLSSEAFLASLRRFIARRGLVNEILCDNGTNLVGASNELKAIMKSIQGFQTEVSAANFGIKWHFNPPRAPHFGGIFEAAVKSFKRHIFKIAGTANLTFVELYTLVAETEAILNSRPLVALSSDPNDIEYITPGHFLVGSNLMSLPEVELYDAKENTLSRWQRVQQLREHFWRRWYKEYLHEMQKRKDWKKSSGETIRVGQVVIVKEDNCPSRCWKVGRIKEVHPGPDGIIRVATIRTTNGDIRRPVLRLCVLCE